MCPGFGGERWHHCGVKGKGIIDYSNFVIAPKLDPFAKVPGIALFYTIIEASQAKTRTERFQAGFIARTTATTLLLPLVVIKTKIEFGLADGMISASRQIYKENKIRGFWKGLMPTIARDG